MRCAVIVCIVLVHFSCHVDGITFYDLVSNLLPAVPVRGLPILEADFLVVDGDFDNVIPTSTSKGHQVGNFHIFELSTDQLDVVCEQNRYIECKMEETATGEGVTLKMTLKSPVDKLFPKKVTVYFYVLAPNPVDRQKSVLLQYENVVRHVVNFSIEQAPLPSTLRWNQFQDLSYHFHYKNVSSEKLIVRDHIGSGWSIGCSAINNYKSTAICDSFRFGLQSDGSVTIDVSKSTADPIVESVLASIDLELHLKNAFGQTMSETNVTIAVLPNIKIEIVDGFSYRDTIHVNRSTPTGSKIAEFRFRESQKRLLKAVCDVSVIRCINQHRKDGELAVVVVLYKNLAKVDPGSEGKDDTDVPFSMQIKNEDDDYVDTAFTDKFNLVIDDQ